MQFQRMNIAGPSPAVHLYRPRQSSDNVPDSTGPGGSPMFPLRDPRVVARIDRLDLPFNAEGVDPYGVSREHLELFYSAMALVYDHYLRVTTFDVANVPSVGPAILVGNHSGGIAFDAAMALTSLLLEPDVPRHAHGMVEYFLSSWPFASTWLARTGQFRGTPEHAERLLRDGRLLMVFPEGARGTGKLFSQRYQLERFGTGFMRLALQTGAPVIPFAFVGGEEAFPTMLHLRGLARLVRAPYVPVPPQLVPVPLPIACQLYYGEPMYFEGDGRETDEVIAGHVSRVRNVIRRLIERGRAARPNDFMLRRMPGEDEPLTR